LVDLRHFFISLMFCSLASVVKSLYVAATIELYKLGKFRYY